jgi:hypothetical protein
LEEALSTEEKMEEEIIQEYSKNKDGSMMGGNKKGCKNNTRCIIDAVLPQGYLFRDLIERPFYGLGIYFGPYFVKIVSYFRSFRCPSRHFCFFHHADRWRHSESMYNKVSLRITEGLQGCLKRPAPTRSLWSLGGRI